MFTSALWLITESTKWKKPQLEKNHSTVSKIQQPLGVWVETQKPAWTGLRRTNGENRVIMKKWNLIGKNKYFLHFSMKTWNEEDPYGILFHIAVCPEEPCGIDFFKKSSENRDPKKSKKSKIRNLVKIDAKSMSID